MCFVWDGWHIPPIGFHGIISSALVFSVFQIFVFGRLVKKHPKRIGAYTEERHFFFKFFELCTTGLESYTVPLGLGKWITSVTMTVFYVLLYYVWRQRYRIKGRNGLTAAVYGLAVARAALCMMPQNLWLSADAPLIWGIYRNIPFALLGLLIIVLFYKSAKEHGDQAFRWMWLTIVLSFGFYIPVVLWADAVPLIGMLMIPKTCAYVWTVLIGYSAMKKECG